MYQVSFSFIEFTVKAIMVAPKMLNQKFQMYFTLHCNYTLQFVFVCGAVKGAYNVFSNEATCLNII